MAPEHRQRRAGELRRWTPDRDAFAPALTGSSKLT